MRSPEFRSKDPSGVEAKEIPEVTADRQAANELIALAEAHLRNTFEGGKTLEADLAFHNTGHTDGVRERTKAIMEAMKNGGVPLSAHDLVVADLSAAAHDLVQEWNQNITQGKVLRKRFAVTNEQASVAMMLKWMSEQEIEKEEKLFTDADKKEMLHAIKATIPGFDPKLGTVIQPHLSPESSPITRAVAMGDLGEAGMNPDGYLAGGDALFREENLDMLDLDPTALTDDEKKAYHARMLGWTKFQPVFARGRKTLLEKEIAGLPEQAQKNIRSLFSKFDESIARSEARAKEREGMSFEELYQDMGYKVKTAAKRMAS